MYRHIRSGIALVSVVLFAAACGGSDSDSDSGGTSGGGSGLTVTSPKDGDTVPSTFMLTFTSSEELGEPDTGKDHVHVFTDGKTDDYTVVAGNSFEVKDLPTGQHTVGITLQHADHSSAGQRAEVTVNVSESGSAPAASPSEDADVGGY